MDLKKVVEAIEQGKLRRVRDAKKVLGCHQVSLSRALKTLRDDFGMSVGPDPRAPWTIRKYGKWK